MNVFDKSMFCNVLSGAGGYWSAIIIHSVWCGLSCHHFLLHSGLFIIPINQHLTYGPTLLLWRSHLHTCLGTSEGLYVDQCWRAVFRCSTDHIRSYNVKSHWKVQGRNFTHEKASNRLRWDLHSNSVGSKVHCLGRDLNSQVLKHRELGICKAKAQNGWMLWLKICRAKRGEIFICLLTQDLLRAVNSHLKIPILVRTGIPKSQFHTWFLKSQFQTEWNPKIPIFSPGIPKSQIGLPGPINNNWFPTQKSLHTAYYILPWFIAFLG